VVSPSWASWLLFAAIITAYFLEAIILFTLFILFTLWNLNFVIARGLILSKKKVKVQLTAEIAESAEVFKVKTITVYSW